MSLISQHIYTKKSTYFRTVVSKFGLQLYPTTTNCGLKRVFIRLHFILMLVLNKCMIINLGEAMHIPALQLSTVAFSCIKVICPLQLCRGSIASAKNRCSFNMLMHYSHWLVFKYQIQILSCHHISYL